MTDTGNYLSREQLDAVLTCLEHDIFASYGIKPVRSDRRGSGRAGLRGLKRAYRVRPAHAARERRTRIQRRRDWRLKRPRRSVAGFLQRRALYASGLAPFAGAWRRKHRRWRNLRVRPMLVCRRCGDHYIRDDEHLPYMLTRCTPETP